MTDNQKKINILIKQLKSKMDCFLRLEKLNLLRDLASKEKNDNVLKTACKVIIDLINRNVKDFTTEQQIQALQMLKDAHTQFGRYNFKSFLIAMEWDRPVEKRFFQPRMKVLEGVVHDLQDLGDGKIDIYALSMPPRVGKSTIGLFFITWMSGRFPDEHIFAAGYASGLVGTFYKGVLDFIDSPEYRFYEIFPETEGKLSKSAENRTIDIHEDERYKTATFRSIDGQITGALEASSLLYLDDMCSGIEEAMNRDRLDKLWSKVTVDLMQRRVMNKRTGRLAPILAIGTIWSLHDPISRLKQQYGDSVMYRARVMPALNIEGESNFNYDYGVGFTTDMYNDLKSGMDEVSWECVFQQNPMERDGLLFPAGTLRRYLQLPNREPDAILASCDVAFGGNDYLSFPIAEIYDGAAYITDVVFRKRASYEITEPMVAGKIVSKNVQIARFEANKGGDFYARDVDTLVREGSSHRCNITWLTSSNKLGKLTRIIQYAPDIREFYYKDPSLYSAKSDYGRFMTNLTTFLETGSSENDDAPDSLAMLANMIKEPRVGKISSHKGVRGVI